MNQKEKGTKHQQMFLNVFIQDTQSTYALHIQRYKIEPKHN